MRIGIDFDNTLVCYDQLFWTLARNRGMIDQSIPQCKEAVRNSLRQRGLESVWTEMQGEAYGSRILEAVAFPGAPEALREFSRRGWEVFVISHKTRSPFAGPNYDLHAAARSWLAAQGLLDATATNLSPERVHFELTRQEKLQRIASLGCDWFIDDLPELLTANDFPQRVGRILFDPHRTASDELAILRLHDWSDAADLIAGELTRGR